MIRLEHFNRAKTEFAPEPLMLYLVSEAEWNGLDWIGLGYAQMHSKTRTLKRETTRKKRNNTNSNE